MIIKNCTIETIYEYTNDDETSFRSQNRIEYLKVSIPIPGGEIIFKYSMSDAEKTALENAAKLAGDK